MNNPMSKWLAGMFLIMAGLGLAGCDKLSSVTKAPEVEPTAPANSNDDAKTTAITADSQDAFVSEKGGFMVTLPPGFPPFTLTEGDSDDTEDIALSYLSENQGRDACLIMVNSQANWDGMDPKTVLDAGRDGGVSSNEGNTLEREVDFRVNGFPGRRIFIRQQSDSATYFIRDDIALVKTRLYQIMYISNKRSDLNTPKILAYFNSFKLIDALEVDSATEAPEPVNKRRLEFTLPSDWVVQSDEPTKDGATTTMMSFSMGSDIFGVYVISDDAGDNKVEALIPGFMEGVENTNGGGVWDNIKILESTKTSWGGVRCDCRVRRVSDDSMFYWSNVFIVLDGNFHAITVVTLDDSTKKYQSAINSFFDSIVVN